MSQRKSVAAFCKSEEQKKANPKPAYSAHPPRIRRLPRKKAEPCGLNTALLFLLFNKGDEAGLHAVIILLDIIIVKMLL